MSEFDVMTARELASLTGSLIAVTSTLYFWLIRSNDEKPNLELFALKPPEGSVMLPQEQPHGFYKFCPSDDHVCAMYWLDLAVVNNSTLPNAILGLQASMRLADNTWREAMVQTPDETPLPLNLSPLTTIGLPVTLSLPIEGPLGSDNAARAMQATNALTKPIQLRISLHGLKNRTFDVVLTDSADAKRPYAQMSRAA